MWLVICSYLLTSYLLTAGAAHGGRVRRADEAAASAAADDGVADGAGPAEDAARSAAINEAVSTRTCVSWSVCSTRVQVASNGLELF